MTVSSFVEKVFDYIRLHGPVNAKQIADALGVERTDVNPVLYGALRGKVEQNRNFQWSLASAPKPGTASTPTVKNSRESLFAYYLDCLAQDGDNGISVIADANSTPDYVEIEGWPFETALPELGGQPLRDLSTRQTRDARRKVLSLGYPALLRRVRDYKGREGASLEPVLIWPQDLESASLAFLPEPQLNIRVLANLVGDENAVVEAAKLAEELGLDAPELPPIDELVSRLRDLRPEWPWREALAPAPFRRFGELRKVKESGIYNAAIVVLSERSPFTVGLERELNDMCGVEDAAITESSLGILLGSAGPRVPHQGALLEPAPLNAEQRLAVRQALSEPLTVITGPPGTGKSQVVTAILVNAAWRGQRVLFASKNNKAVDVVMDRVNALSSRPIVMRLGAGALQARLAQHITDILSARPADDDRHIYEALLARLHATREALDDLDRRTNALLALRNNVDALEQAAEPSRRALPPAIFKDADQQPIVLAEIAICKLETALQRADREKAGIFTTLAWPFVKTARESAVAVQCGQLAAMLKDCGYEADPTGPVKLLAAGKQYVGAIKIAAAYKSALSALSTAPDLSTLTSELAERTLTVAELSSAAWQRWATLLPDHLSPQDRAALGDFAAILKMIVSADSENGPPVGKALWRRYYQLAAQTTKALPCWAVTALSARGRVPFSSGVFDLLVIDEASQCDIASALPLLFRTKRAVIIGDPQQLGHISRLTKAADQALLVKHGLLHDPGPVWGYRANSLYDLAAAKADSKSIVVLRDHHRSHANIINFSNNFFYGGRLRVATNYRRLKRPDGPAVRWINVIGRAIRPTAGSAVNEVEAQAVVDELRRLAITERFSGEMGVVTPFRAQANLIEELLARDGALASMLATRNFISETAHKFQGDERDLIIFSPVLSQGITDSATDFLKSQGNIFNVGISRARGALIVVGDVAACMESRVEYLSAFCRYVASLDATSLPPDAAPPVLPPGDSTYPTVAHPERVSDWEKVFYVALVEAGLRPVPQFDVDQYALDLALIRPNGRQLDIEIDGERYHKDWDGELLRRDQLRNLRLIEMGWDVLRFWVYEIRDNVESCVARVAAWVETADTRPAVVDVHSLPASGSTR